MGYDYMEAARANANEAEMDALADADEEEAERRAWLEKHMPLRHNCAEHSTEVCYHTSDRVPDFYSL